ncbi:hypothetical protein SMD10_13655 [Consotaella sp. CSK11QG-6]
MKSKEDTRERGLEPKRRGDQCRRGRSNQIREADRETERSVRRLQVGTRDNERDEGLVGWSAAALPRSRKDHPESKQHAADDALVAQGHRDENSPARRDQAGFEDEKPPSRSIGQHTADRDCNQESHGTDRQTDSQMRGGKGPGRNGEAQNERQRPGGDARAGISDPEPDKGNAPNGRFQG